MARRPSPPAEKPLHWVGSSKCDFLAFPDPVKSDMGYALGLAQLGGKHPHAKPWKGEGPGVFEVVESHDGDAYRAIYTVRFEGAVYALQRFRRRARRASARRPATWSSCASGSGGPERTTRISDDPSEHRT